MLHKTWKKKIGHWDCSPDIAVTFFLWGKKGTVKESNFRKIILFLLWTSPSSQGPTYPQVNMGRTSADWECKFWGKAEQQGTAGRLGRDTVKEEADVPVEMPAIVITRVSLLSVLAIKPPQLPWRLLSLLIASLITIAIAASPAQPHLTLYIYFFG